MQTMPQKTKGQKTVYWLTLIFYMAMMFVTFLSSEQINKLASALIIPFAFVLFIVKADFDNLLYLKNISGLIIGMYFMQLVVSMAIWLLNFTPQEYITYGLQKFLFQFICIFASISCVYFFQGKAVDIIFYSACLTIGYRIVVAFITRGAAASFESIRYFFTSMGEQSGFMKDIEVHEMTYTFGLFLLYYLFMDTGSKKSRIIKSIMAVFFFVSGWKRIGALAIVVVVILGFIIKRVKPDKRFRLIMVMSVIMLVVWEAYVPIVRDDLLTKLMNAMNIDMKGRAGAYDAVKDMYAFSAKFVGYGYDYLGKFLTFLLHNDIVKTYIEQGFFGFTLFMVYRWIVMTWVILKKVGSRAGMLYFLINVYSFITYAVGNTCYSYLVLICLWTILVASEYHNKGRINEQINTYISNRVENVMYDAEKKSYREEKR